MSVWFMACWLFATNANGIAASSLKRSLAIGSYQTAWTMLHRLRSVAVRPRRERLQGVVEVDETFIGGIEPGLAGGRAQGKKALVGIAVEVLEPRGIGRCRMAPLPDASRDSLAVFLRDHVEPGSKVVTNAWRGYSRLGELGYDHERRSYNAARAEGGDLEALLPAVHRVASLTKRWLLGTHQGRVSEDHLLRYLNEFVFRFNRRTARNRGLLFYRLLENALRHEPLTNRDLVMNARPRSVAPTPPTARGHPASLEQARSRRPWRHPTLLSSD